MIEYKDIYYIQNIHIVYWYLYELGRVNWFWIWEWTAFIIPILFQSDFLMLLPFISIYAVICIFTINDNVFLNEYKCDVWNVPTFHALYIGLS